MDDQKDRSYWEGRANEVKFLFNKIEWMRQRILEESENLPQELISDIQGKYPDARQDMFEEAMQEKDIELDEDTHIAEQWFVKWPHFSHPSFYLLDSYFITVKRMVEYLMMLLRDFHNPSKAGNSFSWSKFRKHLDDETEQKSKFYLYLQDERPELMDFITENKEWIEKVVNRRDYLIHQGIELGMDQTKIEIIYENEVDTRDPDEVKEPEKIEIDGETLDEKLNNDKDKIEELRDLVNHACGEIVLQARVERRMESFKPYLAKFFE